MNALTQWLATYYDEVEPLEFYREIFPDGTLQQVGVHERGVYNGIMLAVTNMKNPDGSTRIRRYTVTNDLSAITAACMSDDFCLMSPISYAGKQRTAENARYLYAIAVDLDRIRVRDGVPYGLSALMERHVDVVGRIPRPTFIVSSGTGVHLYYVLDARVPLFPDVAKALQLAKHDLTDLIWHDTICDIKSKQDIQQEGIYQGFRVPGTITKTGTRARAFRTGDRVSLEYLNQFLPEEHRVQLDQRQRSKGLTLAQAKEKYPTWYTRRIEQGEPRGAIPYSRRLYDWWKRQIISGATVGHRYWCMTMLAVYARKCSVFDEKKNPNPVTREELERDAWDLMAHMESLTNDEANHFTTDDIMKALESFDEKWLTYPRAAVQYRSGIIIPPNKRNHLSRVDHIQLMNFMRKLRHTPGGAPTKQNAVEAWQQQHPEGRKADCHRDTRLSRTTIDKWWKND